jgi:hypothetical protein
MEIQSQGRNPRWWTEDHTRGWDRVKEAFRRDWEQTKADLSKTKGQKLDQQVGDTVKQAMGKETIPAPGQPNNTAGFEKVEDAYRYGYGARMYYGSAKNDWDDDLDEKLEEEWMELGRPQGWDDARPFVRQAWSDGRS